jgi:hypothetical protein
LGQTYLIDRTDRPDPPSNDVCNSLEVLTNLVYLTRHSLAEEEKAVFYLDMAVTQLRRLTDLLSTRLA